MAHDSPVVSIREVGADVENGHIDTSSPELSNRHSLQFDTLEGNSARYGVFSTISLTWEDLKVTANIEQGKGPKCLRKSKDGITKKDILKGVSGICKPGTFMAIMGASGAGKTTLLNTLARRNKTTLEESGTILVNGKQLTRRKTTMVTAYVQQEDYFIGTLTVQEVLMFHAVLRMDRSICMKEKKARVKKVMNELGLTKIAGSLCGLPSGIIRGISGGERKRLSVACELLMNPPLLFIDEPTSGLDSFMARNIVKLIGKLARANRTILCTIHQPASEVFNLFDRLYLVAEGGCAFTGTCAEGLEFFKSINYPCPPNFNPADHYIFTLAIVPGEEEKCHGLVEDIKGKFAESPQYTDLQRDIADSNQQFNELADNAAGTLSKVFERRSAVSTLDQFKANMVRSYLNVVRNPSYIRIRVFQCLVLSLLGGLAYLRTGNDQEAFQDKSGLLFFLVTSLTFGNVFVQTQAIPFELPIIKREYRNGMYGPSSYLISRLILEVPYLVVLTSFTWIPVWGIAGLHGGWGPFWTGFTACLGVAWVATTLGIFIACCTGNAIIASAVTPLIILPFFLFGGLYQNEASTPYYFYPVKYCSWFRYGYSMLLINEFNNVPIECNPNSTTPCVFTSGNEILDYYNIDTGDLWFPNLFVLFVMGLCYCAIAFLCLHNRVRQRK